MTTTTTMMEMMKMNTYSDRLLRAQKRESAYRRLKEEREKKIQLKV